MWPEHYPEGCPPSDAVGKNVEVFRLVDSNPPTNDDFLSEYEKNPTRRFDNVILACGLSCFTELEYAQKQNDFLAGTVYFKRKGLSKKMVARGATYSNCGVVKKTPARFPTHLTYWLHSGTTIAQHFSVF